MILWIVRKGKDVCNDVFMMEGIMGQVRFWYKVMSRFKTIWKDSELFEYREYIPRTHQMQTHKTQKMILVVVGILSKTDTPKRLDLVYRLTSMLPVGFIYQILVFFDNRKFRIQNVRCALKGRSGEWRVTPNVGRFFFLVVCITKVERG